jgi:hypothetical protein
MNEVVSRDLSCIEFSRGKSKQVHTFLRETTSVSKQQQKRQSIFTDLEVLCAAGFESNSLEH